MKWWLLGIGLATCAGVIAICIFNIYMAYKDRRESQ